MLTTALSLRFRAASVGSKTTLSENSLGSNISSTPPASNTRNGMPFTCSSSGSPAQDVLQKADTDIKALRLAASSARA